jgi:hypothetical protein
MFQTKVVEKIKTYILCSITFSRKSCRLWDNVEKYGRARQATDDNIIQRMRFACCITKATNTHWEYVILIDFPQLQWLRERASMLRLHAHCLSCFNIAVGGTYIYHLALMLNLTTSNAVNIATFKTDHWTRSWVTSIIFGILTAGKIHLVAFVLWHMNTLVPPFA